MMPGRVVILAVTLASLAVVTAAGEPPPQAVIAGAARKVVKLYGAGGLRGLEAYQSGILVSPDGRILTAATSVLDCEQIDCVLDDGRRFVARLVGIDARRELAVLTIEAADLPCFTLAPDAEPAAPGTRVLALSNMFGVAAGDERVTVQRGVITAAVPLEARRGAAEAPFRGTVYVLDCTTNNPGSAGGGLVDPEGALVGMLGKELRSTAAGIWLNYALPQTELAAGLDAVLTGSTATVDPEAEPFDPRRLGVVLVPDLIDRTPPFVESVDPASIAARAGLRPDDLLIAVAGRTVTTRQAVEAALGALAEGDPVTVTVIRGGGVVDVDLGPRPGDSAP